MKRNVILILIIVFSLVKVHAQENSVYNEKFTLTKDVSSVKPSKTSNPPKEDIIFGNPLHRSWILDTQENGVQFGVWEGTKGKWKFSVDNWEYCRILFGISVITNEKGQSFTVKEGDSFVLHPGFSGTWEALETTRKEFIVK
ncbi:cupin [Flavobacterium sp. HMWF030]|nr:cupin [Flavobacterium sp. HMWF030]